MQPLNTRCLAIATTAAITHVFAPALAALAGLS